MKKQLFMLTLVCVVLLSMVSVTAAEDAPGCGGLLTALERMPPHSRAYARLLSRAQEQCPEGLERAALLAFYHSTDGPNWYYPWPVDNDEHHCYWHGVECGHDDRVLRLVLTMYRLNGNIPPELGNLSNLWYLEMLDNNLSGAIPPELGNLTELQYVDLANNQLSGAIPPELGNLTKLEILFLNENQLSGEIPLELGNLTYLQRLSLWDNQLSGEIPAEFGNFADLQWLGLNNNQLSGPIPPVLGDLSNLRLLNLNTNELSGPIPWELGNLGNLSHLRLYENELTCWETEEVLLWASALTLGEWDDPPGTTICP